MVRKFVFLFVALLMMHVEGEGKTPPRISRPILTIVDTDCDVDGMMALLYLLKSPEVDVKAITTVGDGIGRWEYGAPNISNLIELAGYPRIPVSYGARRSMSPVGTVPSKWRDEVDTVMGLKLPTNPIQPVSTRSPELMKELITSSPNKITLLCIGPLTNLALALEAFPEIKKKIDRIFILGGAIVVPGNIIGRPQGFRNRVAEYNIFLDAKAAQNVFDSGVPVTLIPLDAAEHAPITKGFFETLSTNRKTPSANFVYEILKPYIEMRKRQRNYFWDPVAAVIMTHPELATYRDLKLTINLKKGPEYGRVMMAKIGPTIRVVTSIDSEKFYDVFLNTLNRSSHLKPSH